MGTPSYPRGRVVCLVFEDGGVPKHQQNKNLRDTNILLQKFPLYKHYCCYERCYPHDQAAYLHLFLLPEGELLFYLYKLCDCVATVMVECVVQYVVAVDVLIFVLEYCVATLDNVYAVVYNYAVAPHAYCAERISGVVFTDWKVAAATTAEDEQ